MQFNLNREAKQRILNIILWRIDENRNTVVQRKKCVIYPTRKS